MSVREADQDVAFLLARAMAAGSCDFTSARWTGMSSNSIVAVAYGEKQTNLPSDRGDWAACVRTFQRLPRHRRTATVREAMRKAKANYLKNYPDDCTAARRNAAYAAWEAKRAKREKAA